MKTLASILMVFSFVFATIAIFVPTNAPIFNRLLAAALAALSGSFLAASV